MDVHRSTGHLTLQIKLQAHVFTIKHIAIVPIQYDRLQMYMDQAAIYSTFLRSMHLVNRPYTCLLCQYCVQPH